MRSALIVDDDADIRDSLVAALEGEGFSCQRAADGAEALRQMRDSPVRLVVLLDLMMPRMDGRAVLEQVAADPHLAGRHAILLLTAAADPLPLPLVQMMDRLDVGVVFKPFDVDALLEVVRGAVAWLHGDEPTPTSTSTPMLA